MSKEKSTKPRELTPLSSKAVRDIGRQLAYFAQQYNQVADEMDASTIQEIAIKGATNLSLTMDRFSGAVQSLQAGLLKARKSPLKITQPSIEESQADVLARREQQTRTKKGSAKRKPSG